MANWLDAQTLRHMWVKFAASVLCFQRFFSGYSGFPLSSKTKRFHICTVSPISAPRLSTFDALLKSINYSGLLIMDTEVNCRLIPEILTCPFKENQNDFINFIFRS